MDNNISAEPKTVLKDKYRSSSIIAGVLFLLYVLIFGFGAFPVWLYFSFWRLSSLLVFLVFQLFIVSNILLAVGLFAGKKNTFLIVSSVLYAVSMIILPLIREGVNISDLLCYLSRIMLSVIIVLSCTNNKKIKGVLRKLFFIPAVIYLIYYCSLLGNVVFGIILNLLEILIYFSAMLFTALWVVNDPVYVTVAPNNPKVL